MGNEECNKWQVIIKFHRVNGIQFYYNKHPTLPYFHIHSFPRHQHKTAANNIEIFYLLSFR